MPVWHVDYFGYLGDIRDPYGKQLVGLIGPADIWLTTWHGLTENENGGKTLHFATGNLVSYDFRNPPFLIYGKIHQLWSDINNVKSGLGHPLAHPQIPEDGTICNIFEGGHIHLVEMRDAEMYVTAPNVLDTFHGSIATVSLQISAQPSTN